MKNRAILIILLFSFNNLFAQSTHTIGCGLCKYSKNYNANRSEKSKAALDCGCRACDEVEQKEKAARTAEDNKIIEAKAAVYKAAQIAKQKALAEARQREADAQKKREIDAANEQKRQKELQLKNAALAKKYNLNTYDVVKFLEDVKEFTDPVTRTYGLKSKDKTILNISYPENIRFVGIDRIGKSNFFEITHSKDNEGWDNRIYVMDMFGKHQKVDGENYFYEIRHNAQQNSITLYKVRGDFRRKFEDYCFDRRYFETVSSVEDVEIFGKNARKEEEAAWKKKTANDPEGTVYLTMPGCREFNYAPVDVYVVDYNFNLMEKHSAYLIVTGGHPRTI